MNSSGSDGRAVLWATIGSSAMMAELVSGKATRDALFLHAFGPSGLPAAMIGAAILSFALVELSGQAMLRFGPVKVVRSAFVCSALAFVAEWALSFPHPSASALAVYLHVVAVGSVLSSGFWSVVSERFDPRSAKRHVGRIAAGGSFGGIFGGLLAWRLATASSVPSVLLLLAGLNGVSAWGVSRLGRGVVERVQAGGSGAKPVAGLRIVKSVPYLRHLAMLVLCGAAAQALLDYVLSAKATEAWKSGTGLMAFFSLFYVGTGTLGLVGQMVFGRPSIRRLGLAGSVAVLPGAVALGALLAAGVNSFVGSVVMRAAELVTRNAVYRSGYELLYTPLTHEKKRLSKAFIDVGADRLGTSLGSGLTMVLLWVWGSSAHVAIMLATCGVACIGAWFASRLHRGYISALEESLRTGSVELAPEDVEDRATLDTMTHVSGILDRRTLLEQVARLQATQERSASEDQDSERPDWAPPAQAELAEHDATTDEPIAPLLQCVRDLNSGVSERIERWLRPDTAFDIRCTAQVISLVSDDAHARSAIRALRRIAPRVTGQLVDSLLDASLPATLRRRIPRILRVCATQRSVDGLLAGLDDPEFDVRYDCGRALFALTEPTGPAIDSPALHRGHGTARAADAVEGDVRSSPSPGPEAIASTGSDGGGGAGFVLPAARLFELAKAELDGARGPRTTTVEPTTLHDDDSVTTPAGNLLASERDHRLQHAVTLLALVLDREPLTLAFAATRSSDPNLRGTALEYLDTVVPKQVAAVLLPMLELRQATPERRRTHEEVRDALLRARKAIETGLARSEGAIDERQC